MPAASPATRVLLAQKATGDLRWKRTVRDALDQAGTVNAAAVLLGIGRSTLQRLLEEEPDLVAGIAMPEGPGNPKFRKTHIVVPKET